LYRLLQERAAGGDEWARDYLARVEAHVAAAGKALPPKEVSVGRVDTVSGIPVTVKGIVPFYLEIYNRQEFAAVSQVEAYVQSRKATLAQLASQDADRQIEVSISPTACLGLSEAWKLKDTYALDVDEIAIEIWLRGERHSVMGVGDAKDPGERPVIDFTLSAEAVEARLRELLPPQVATAEGRDRADLEFKVAWIRGKMRAADALELASIPTIMLVDPISDLVDAYRGSAVEVRVVTVPHLLAIRERMGIAPDGRLLPAAGQPTPAPVRR
jgi:hypothetical protein